MLKDHPAVVEQLLAAGANTDVKFTVRGDWGVEERGGSKCNTQFFFLSL